MKKFILIIPLFIVLLSSCSTTKKLVPRERIIHTFYFDFSQYAKEGFLISPNSYVGEFESCGVLELEVIPEKKVTKGKTVYSSSDNSYTQEEYLIEEKITGEELLKLIVEKAKLKGGNAIVNFKMSSTSYDTYSPEAQDILTTKFYSVEGFVIKRK